MGIFDFLKKKKGEDNMEPIDGIPPSTWLPTTPPVNDYDRSRPRENNYANTSKTAARDKSHNVFGEDLSRLNADGELPLGWIAYNQDFTKRQEQEIDRKWNIVYTSQSTAEKLEAFRQYFDSVTKIGEVCRNAGECHYKWFCEYIIESTWYNQQLKEYDDLKANSANLIRREKLIETLEADIMSKLSKHNGILQSDFTKMFDPLIKNDVIAFLYQADKDGKIQRTKSGRSYILNLK